MSASGAQSKAALIIDCVEERRRPGKLDRIKHCAANWHATDIGHPNNSDVSIVHRIWILLF
jgi:hypothetical protein